MDLKHSFVNAGRQIKASAELRVRQLRRECVVMATLVGAAPSGQ